MEYPLKSTKITYFNLKLDVSELDREEQKFDPKERKKKVTA